MFSNIPTLAAALAFLTALSGCASPAQELMDPMESEDKEGGEIIVYGRSFYLEAASPLRHPIPGTSYEFSSQHFNTTPDATAIVVEVAWNDTFQDLDAELKFEEDIPCHTGFPSATCTVLDPTGHPQALVNHWLGQDVGQFKNDGGSLGAPDNPSRIIVEGDDLRHLSYYCEEICEWYTSADNKGPFIDLDWHLYISIFYGVEIPDGYTAIPWLKMDVEPNGINGGKY